MDPLDVSLAASTCRRVVVTCYLGFILRHRFLKPPARPQTPLAAFGAHGKPGYRRDFCATIGGVPERARVRHG
jgi:hypothetical protein